MRDIPHIRAACVKRLVVILLVLLLPAPAYAQQTFSLRGSVRDAVTGEPLTAAILRTLGTSRGTITSTEGRYLLPLPPGRHTIVASMLGYAPDTANVDLKTSTQLDFSLQPADILLPEVVVTAEDPAVGIMRRVIANKHIWREQLHSYTLDAFTRQTLMRDTAVASITESFTKGYWQQGDTLREVILQRRQTANIQPGFNFASVGRIVNFYDDDIRFLGYTFVGPTSPQTFDYYTFKLLRTRTRQGHDAYEIALIPESRTTPLFRGTITVTGDTYALAGVDVEPNEAFILPFVREKHLRYRQQFSLYEERFWLPADIRIDAALTVSLLGLSIPPIVFHQTSVISGYAINVPIPDSIAHKPRLAVDSAATKTDSTFWATHPVLPLTAREEIAYQKLDSTQTLDVQFRPGGVTATLGGGAEGASSLLSLLDMTFNRVEGLHLGLRGDADPLKVLNVRAGVAYGFSSKRSTLELGATLYTSSTHALGLGFDIYRQVFHRPDQGFHGRLFNMVGALLVKSDYFDYYRADGWRVSLETAAAPWLNTRLSYLHEYHRSMSNATDYSFFSRSKSYRPNPPVTEGKFRSFLLEGRVGPERVPFGLMVRDNLEFSIETAPASLSDGRFSFNRYLAAGTVTIPTLSRSFLFPPMLYVRAAVGLSTGTLPSQRLFDLESGASGYGPFGVFRAMRVKEYSGTGFVALQLEHNFRTLPFLALGIPFLYENSIELLVHGGAARTWNSGPLALPTTAPWYYEAGIGLSRIFDLLRIDLTYRFTEPKGIAVSAALAPLL